MDVCAMPEVAETDVAGVIQWALAEAEIAPRRKPLPWSEGEDEFLRQNLGVLSENAIGAALGRTLTAVHLRWKRDLGLPAPSKTPGYVTANQAAKMLAVDAHAVCRWIERGWLRARQLPFRNRKVWRIRVEDLKRFAVKPEHWILFRPDRMRDPALARLVALAVERWGDEWLTPSQVAETHGVGHQDVNRYIHAGKLPAVKWGNWRIRRSDAEQVYFHKGRGSGHQLGWSGEGDAFLVLARAVGLSLAAIGHLVDWPSHRVRPRLVTLHRTGQIPLLVGKYGLEGVQYRREDGRLLAGWDLHRGRFPTLARAMDRFAAGESLRQAHRHACHESTLAVEPRHEYSRWYSRWQGRLLRQGSPPRVLAVAGQALSPLQAECVRGVLWAWAAFYLGSGHSLARRLQVSGGRGRGLFPARLRALYRELRAAGVDPCWTKSKSADEQIALTMEVQDATVL